MGAVQSAGGEGKHPNRLLQEDLLRKDALSCKIGLVTREFPDPQYGVKGQESKAKSLPKPPVSICQQLP